MYYVVELLKTLQIEKSSNVKVHQLPKISDAFNLGQTSVRN